MSGLANFMIRVSPEILKKIDKLVEQGKYSSRSDFAKMAISNFLTQGEAKDNIETSVRTVINEGACDEILEKRMKAMFKKIIANQ